MSLSELRGNVFKPEVIRGKDGKSAYEIAVMHGFEGTEDEWIEELEWCRIAAQNEPERVSAELMRKAQFTSWEAAMAALPSFDTHIRANSDMISCNSKRITNLEQGLTPDPFETDDSVAYMKDVPSNALPYAEINKVGGASYRSGDNNAILDAKVTGIKIVGANLLPYPYVSNTGNINGISATINKDQSVSFSGKASTFSQFKVFNGSLRVTADSIITMSGLITNSIGAVLVVDGAEKYLSQAAKSLLISAGSTITVINLNIYANVDISITVSVMLNKGKTALVYTPYTSAETFPIPEEVQALDGYGRGIPDTEYYNYIEWSEDGKAEWHQVCAKRAYEEGDEKLDGVVTDGVSETVYLLDEPIVTDISDLITLDNLISVEGGGALIFENEHDYAVPSEVTYQLKGVTA